MNSLDSSLRSSKFDRIDSGLRQATYDRMARTLHHPSYKSDMINHYDELARYNRKFHNLNYPCPPPSMKEMENPTDFVPKPTSTSIIASKSRLNGTQSSYLASSSKAMRSIYMSSTRMQNIKTQMSNLKDQLLIRAQKGSIPDQDQIYAILIHHLLQNGVDFDTIRLALEDSQIVITADPKTSEFVIELKL